jgi:hypothetical protein
MVPATWAITVGPPCSVSVGRMANASATTLIPTNRMPRRTETMIRVLAALRASGG